MHGLMHHFTPRVCAAPLFQSPLFIPAQFGLLLYSVSYRSHEKPFYSHRVTLCFSQESVSVSLQMCSAELPNRKEAWFCVSKSCYCLSL